MRALLLLMILALPSMAHAQASLGDARLDMFRAACVDNRGEDRIAAIGRQGWRAVRGESAAALRFVLGAEVTAEEDDGEIEESEQQAFERTVDGHAYHLVIARIRTGYGTVLGCTLYDLTAGGPVDQGLIVRWLNEQPVQRYEDAKSLLGAYWHADTVAGVHDINSAWVAPGGVAHGQAGFSGLALTTALEPAQ